MKKQLKIGVIGLGYVGLPISIALSKYFYVTAFDLSKKRVKSLIKGDDINKDVNLKDNNTNINYTYNFEDLRSSNFYIVCVPTPIKKNKLPDLSYLKKASISIGKVISKNNIVVFESTVYPGTTEEICAPLIEKNSNLKVFKKNDNILKKTGFFIGYSPERINPGDINRKLTNISKLVSSNHKESLNIIYKVYKKIIRAKVYKYDSIKICESAKVIENVQRDVNIALINEFAIIFKKMNIDVYKVLEAASTKWNFLNYKPGLVGGHCIGVDPYYLSYIAKVNGIYPKMILNGREINDSMNLHVVKDIKQISKKLDINFSKSKILIMGYAFKENCSDIRNTQVKNILDKIKNKVNLVHIFDPPVNKNIDKDLKKYFKNSLKKNYYDIIIITVPHDFIIKKDIKYINSLTTKKSFIYDLKNIYNNDKFYTL